jgi:hypothetical protein
MGFNSDIITASTVNGGEFIGQGGQLTGVVAISPSDLGFTVVVNTGSTINQNVVLPLNSTVTYPSPLTMGLGYTLTIPSNTTLTII